jgi:hypothetical protein
MLMLAPMRAPTVAMDASQEIVYFSHYSRLLLPPAVVVRTASYTHLSSTVCRDCVVHTVEHNGGMAVEP